MKSSITRMTQSGDKTSSHNRSITDTFAANGTGLNKRPRFEVASKSFCDKNLSAIECSQQLSPWKFENKNKSPKSVFCQLGFQSRRTKTNPPNQLFSQLGFQSRYTHLHSSPESITFFGKCVR